MKNWINSAKTIYFPHFSGIWTSFNAWYNDFITSGNDRDKINVIKTSPPSQLVRSFEKIADNHSDSLARLARTEPDKMTKGFIQYSFENALTRLYKFAFSNQIIKSTLDNFIINQNIRSIYLPANKFQYIYRYVRNFEDSQARITYSSVSIQDLLDDYGISSKGSIFYNDPAKINKSSKTLPARQIETFVTTELKFDLGIVQESLFADTLEILYQIRNSCVHGDFIDPGSVENNDLFQAAYEFLYRLLALFLGEQPSNLHF